MSYLREGITRYEARGKKFEEDVIVAFAEAFEGSRTYKIRDCGGSVIDKEQGTDFMCGDLRLDITTNFSGKDCMPFIYESDIELSSLHNLKFGVRFGNKYGDFPKPVVVIGTDVLSEDYSIWKKDIVRAIKEQASRIIEIASDCFDDYYTVDRKDRADLFSTPLKRNPLFRAYENFRESRYLRNNLLEHAV